MLVTVLLDLSLASLLVALGLMLGQNRRLAARLASFDADTPGTGEVPSGSVEATDGTGHEEQPAHPASTDPLLFVFSEEFGDREDCSIFYARYLVVEPPPGGPSAAKAEVERLLKVVNGKPDYADSDVRAMTKTPALMVPLLASAGIRAWLPDVAEVVEVGL